MQDQSQLTEINVERVDTGMIRCGRPATAAGWVGCPVIFALLSPLSQDPAEGANRSVPADGTGSSTRKNGRPAHVCTAENISEK